MKHTSIQHLATADRVTIAGKVAEIFGNKLIVEDGTGRALIELGPKGNDRLGARVGSAVEATGRYKEGFLHAVVVKRDKHDAIELEGKHSPHHHEHHPAHDAECDEAMILAAVRKRGFREARIADVKKHHAEVTAVTADGAPVELHVEFDGHIRKEKPAETTLDDAAIEKALSKAGYERDGAATPHKKHMIVEATSPKGRAVLIDVHRDGSLKNERHRSA